MAKKRNIFAEALSHMERASEIAKIDEEAIEKLKYPKSVLQVSIPVRMDDGSLEIFTGFRVHHDDTRGPTKGGIRFHPQVTLDKILALSFWMTLKCALVDLPYGGSKGGIIVDPKRLSPLELQRLSRGYITRIADFIGPNTDIPGPDMYTNPMIMGWMMHEYSSIVRQQTPAVITGKPIPLGGSVGREGATGQGAYICIKALEKKQKWKKKTTTVAIQGFGHAGQSIANILYQDKRFKIVALSESDGGVYRKSGFDIPAIIELKNRTRPTSAAYVEKSICGVCEAAKGESLSNAELLALDVDILILAAIEDQITSRNAADVQAKILVELANGPITPQADEKLIREGKLILPDLLVNAGGVIVSYFEWVQNRSGLYWHLSKVQEKLQELMMIAFDKVYEMVKDENVDMRTAAYIIALNQLGGAITAGGTHQYFTRRI